MTNQNPNEPFQRISTEKAKEMIDRGDIELVDVRQPNEFASVRLSGAKLITVDSLYERIGEVDDDKDVIFYCAVGVRSALACEIGAAMGRTRCFNMEGGIEAWKALNLPVETGAPV